MNISIGEYIRQKLRKKNISNKDAGNSIGLSESAFEKILTQEDIYASRLLKLSELSNENIFEYYYNIEPIKSFHQQEKDKWQTKIDNLLEALEARNELLAAKEEHIKSQEEVIRLLKEKEQFLGK